MTTPDPRYAAQSRFSDPGRYVDLLRRTPPAIGDLAAIVRNTVTHYRAGQIEFGPARLEEINNRWVAKILACDQERLAQPLDVARPEEEHVVGCCRDYTLLTVAALRQHGVPARSRIGFADYFMPEVGFHADHVI